MSRADYIVPLPSLFGKAITEAVRAFAERTGLEVESWVHDLPLWFVSKTYKGAGVVRRVQVGAYWLDEAEEVRVIPQVFRFDKDGRSLFAFEQIDPKFIRTAPLKAVKDPKMVAAALAEAWEDALRMEPPGPSPSNPSPRTISIPVSRYFEW